jgi:hypothetical protein
MGVFMHRLASIVFRVAAPLALLAGVLEPATSASAAGATSTSTFRSDTVRQPSASTALVAPAVSAPTTSPAARTRTFTTGSTLTCPPTGQPDIGWGTAQVRYGSGFYNFGFFTYGTYYLSHFVGTGIAINCQYDQAGMRLLDNFGGEIRCLYTGDSEVVDWGPVYRIQLTTRSCPPS